MLGHDREVAHWVAERIPHMAARIRDFPLGEAFGPGAAIGVADDQMNLLAGVVFHNWDRYCGVMEVSCAAITPRWFSREVARSVLRYPFVQVGCQRLTAVTPRRATSTRRFLEGLGFKREGSARRGFGDDNAIIYGLLVEEWAAHPLQRVRAPGGGLTVEQKRLPEPAASA